MRHLKRLVKQLLPASIKQRLTEPVSIARESWAQEGEDLMLLSLFQHQRQGFYVDIGAHHPQKLSNTYLFYLRGWRGINVDAQPGSMAAFRQLRPEDINIEAAISDSRDTLTYYEFNQPAINGFSKELADQRNDYTIHGQTTSYTLKIVAEHQVQTMPLADVLAQHVPPGRKIDFLSVDVEGLDLQVLKSNDWSRFRPRVVLVEDSEILALDQLGDSQIVQFMGGKGYAPFCRTPLTLFFVERERLTMTPLGPRLTVQ